MKIFIGMLAICLMVLLMNTSIASAGGIYGKVFYRLGDGRPSETPVKHAIIRDSRFYYTTTDDDGNFAFTHITGNNFFQVIAYKSNIFKFGVKNLGVKQWYNVGNIYIQFTDSSTPKSRTGLQPSGTTIIYNSINSIITSKGVLCPSLENGLAQFTGLLGLAPYTQVPSLKCTNCGWDYDFVASETTPINLGDGARLQATTSFSAPITSACISPYAIN